MAELMDEDEREEGEPRRRLEAETREEERPERDRPVDPHGSAADARNLEKSCLEHTHAGNVRPNRRGASGGPRLLRGLLARLAAFAAADLAVRLVPLLAGVGRLRALGHALLHAFLGAVARQHRGEEGGGQEESYRGLEEHGDGPCTPGPAQAEGRGFGRAGVKAWDGPSGARAHDLVRGRPVRAERRARRRRGGPVAGARTARGGCRRGDAALRRDEDPPSWRLVVGRYGRGSRGVGR